MGDPGPPWADAQAYRSRIRGCLLGGAIGDALGAGIEFDSLAAIRAAHGPAGVTGVVAAYGRIGAVTDDTQMTLFTAEGLIRASVRFDGGICHAPSVVHRAYLRWLATQRGKPPERPEGWLAGEAWLYAARAPGNACLSGLSSPEMGTVARPRNPNSKGCGAVMRSAPFGWLTAWTAPQVFQLAVECAVLTHGHPTGYLAAGAFAVMIHSLMRGAGLEEATGEALAILRGTSGADETVAALQAALDACAQGGPPSAERVERLGGGWVAEEALAMGLYCALAASDVRSALLLAVNHSGDSDSTGSICGNLLGALHGETALPADWLVEVEGRGTMLQLADDFALEMTQRAQLHGSGGPETVWAVRYPGS